MRIGNMSANERIAVMKVLFDMDESRFIDAFARNELPGRLIGTEKNMTMDIMFNEEDIWNRMKEFVLDKRALAQIDEFDMRQDFIEDVIKQINKDFDASEGVSWIGVDNAIQDTFDKYSVKFAKFGEDISLDGLRTALQRFDESGKEGLCGSWDIHCGAYDKWWEASYECHVVFGCYASGEFDNSGFQYGYLERECAGISDKTFKDFCDLVHDMFPECRMAPLEQLRVQANSQAQGR